MSKTSEGGPSGSSDSDQECCYAVRVLGLLARRWLGHSMRLNQVVRVRCLVLRSLRHSASQRFGARVVKRIESAGCR
jgi:hypothetical protein